jgi:hypothetical protein
VVSGAGLARNVKKQASKEEDFDEVRHTGRERRGRPLGGWKVTVERGGIYTSCVSGASTSSVCVVGMAHLWFPSHPLPFSLCSSVVLDCLFESFVF